MARNTDFLGSAETLVETAKFFHELSHRIGDGKLPPGEDAKRLAKILGIPLPAALEDATIEAIETGKAADAKAETGTLQIAIALPPEDVPAGGPPTSAKKGNCYRTCFSGPFGVGKICFEVCVTCTFKPTKIACTATISTTVSL